MADDPRRSMADAVAEPLISAYRAGGFGLAFLVLGALLLSSSGLFSGVGRYSSMTIGLVLIGIPCAFFYVKEMRPIAQGSREVRKRREIIEAAQDTAIAMTNITMQMRALAFKNAEEVAKAITLMRPIIQAAGFARVADNRVLVSTDNMAHAIVAVTGGTAKVLEDVQAALVASDPRVLRGYLKQLKAINGQLEDVLAGRYDNVPGIGIASKIIR